MKRVDLIKAIDAMGCQLIRHGAKHDWYRNPISGEYQAVPRHREIKERLAQRILRALRNPEADAPSEGDALDSGD